MRRNRQRIYHIYYKCNENMLLALQKYFDWFKLWSYKNQVATDQRFRVCYFWLKIGDKLSTHFVKKFSPSLGFYLVLYTPKMNTISNFRINSRFFVIYGLWREFKFIRPLLVKDCSELNNAYNSIKQPVLTLFWQVLPKFDLWWPWLSLKNI